jgi:2-succinyl-6-hydroxy-2,4-cyclohexadiene-1-carboxylate synthase
MEDQRIELDKLSIQIREYPNDGETIVFLHFGGANIEMWQGVVPFFKDDYHLVLVDLRGHGKSDKPARGYHIDEMAADVLGVMGKLGIDSAHIIGSSLGAEVGLSVAANTPEKVRSLVCDGALASEYGPYGLWEGTQAEFEEYAAERIEKMRNSDEEVFPSVDALVEAKRQMFAEYGLWNEIYESVVRYDAIEIGEGAYAASWGRMAKDYMEKYYQYQFEDYYRRVRCPLLMLTDAEQETDDKEWKVMQGLAELTPRAKIVELSGWVHPFGWMLMPEAVSEVVLDFLEGAAD